VIRQKSCSELTPCDSVRHSLFLFVQWRQIRGRFLFLLLMLYFARNIYHLWQMDELMGSIAGMVLTYTNWSTERKISVPVCPPQIPRLKFCSGGQASRIRSLKIDPEGLVSYKVSLKFGSEVQDSCNVSKLILRHPVLLHCLRKITIKHVSQT